MWAIGILAVGLSWLVVRRLRGGRHGFAIAVVALALAGLAWQEHRDRSLMSRLDAVASAVAGRRVTISCEGFVSSLTDVGA